MDLKLPKLKIRQQLLLLIIAPLIFQIGISAMLYSELSKVNNNLADLVYRRRILAVLDDLQRAHIESAYTAFFYSIVKKPVLSNRYLWSSQEVVKKKQELADLTRNHREYQRDTELLLRRIDECNHGVHLLMNRDAGNFFGASLDPILSAQINYQVNKWLNPMGDSFLAIRSEPVTPESFSGNAERMRKLISLFFAICVALTVLIAYWGSRSIIVRLSKIYTHVNQVKAGQRPLLKLSGEDELAELDQAIASSAEKLLNLRNFKEDLIQAVSHDLRAPLTSINGILTLARDNAYGKISDSARTALEKPMVRCRSLAALVNDVLDLERAKAEKFNVRLEQLGLAELVELLQKKPQFSGVPIDFADDDLDLEFYGDLEAAGRILMSLCLEGKSSITFSPDSQSHVVATISPAVDRDKDYHQSVRSSLADKLAETCGITISADAEQITLVFPKSPLGASAGTAKVELAGSRFPVRRSRIAEAGLALVIVPAIISCSMLWMLSQMIDQSQNEIQREFRSYQILRCLNAIHASHMYSGICTMMFNLTKTAEFAEKKQAYNQMGRENIQRLESIFAEGSDQQEREMAKRLKEQMQYIATMQQKFLKSTTDEMRENFNALPSYEGGLPTDLYSYRTRLVRQRERLLLEDRTSGLRDRKKAILILLSSLALVAISTIIAHQLLSKVLTRHLFNAINNAKRLNSTEPLKPPEKGTDEMAVLEEYIYDAAQELRHLENQRLELLSLLREELKQPIEETGADIAKVLEAKDEQMPQRAFANIQNVVLELSRLGALVDDLTNIEMIDKSILQINLSNFPVNDVFASTINSLKLLADIKSIKLVPETTDIVLCADRERVLQILVNLVSNAIKFSPNETQVTMTAERSGNGVKLCVKDEGLGISEEDQARIFQKFERAAARQSSQSSAPSTSTAPIPSAGLGLHICKMLVEAHGGSISVSSKAGLGAAFSVFFPDGKVGNLSATLGE